MLKAFLIIGLIVFAVVAFSLLSATTFNAPINFSTTDNSRAEIEITLPQKVDSNNGEWGNFKDKSLQTTKLIIQECKVKINLLSGRTLIYEAVNADLHQRNDFLDSVYLRLKPETYNYDEAVANLEKELKRLSIENNQECILGVKNLKSVQMPDPYRREHLGCYLEIEKNVKLRVGLGTLVGQNRMLWITFLEFNYEK